MLISVSPAFSNHYSLPELLEYFGTISLCHNIYILYSQQNFDGKSKTTSTNDLYYRIKNLVCNTPEVSE